MILAGLQVLLPGGIGVQASFSQLLVESIDAQSGQGMCRLL